MTQRPFKTKYTTAYRSGLEVKISAQIAAAGLPVVYEKNVLTYARPESNHKYTPDFKLPNGIFIETKGYFDTADRQKHLWVAKSHPEADIRFVFTSSKKPIRKGSKTTYAMWCDKHSFKYADKEIPVDWFHEAKA